MKQRARLPNHELAFLENNIAYALSIIQDLKALLYWIDDPDQIHIVSLILADAQHIRTHTIQRMNGRKAQLTKGATQ